MFWTAERASDVKSHTFSLGNVESLQRVMSGDSTGALYKDSRVQGMQGQGWRTEWNVD